MVRHVDGGRVANAAAVPYRHAAFPCVVVGRLFVEMPCGTVRTQTVCNRYAFESVLSDWNFD